MKKIMMLLMVSVFFLMGGMSMGLAQKIGSESEIQVITSPTFIQVEPGQTVRITFSLRGNDLDSKSYVISFWIRRPGQRPIELVCISKEGGILFRHFSAGRITVSYNKYSKTGTVTIRNVISEDEADYFIGVTESAGRWYWSYGTQLTVSYPWSYLLK
ncbi:MULTISPECIES: hypothetical protein [Sanguibacteroides]|uniref:Immunoglobulin domain-containing protein n=1 Tax=Sanguibacteroides justesenii TaxID=1547597 RepID=A0A0C3N9Q5_9PORP|nr:MULTISPECIES: hypothetical protein [Sanguibacteroides]KIO42762.1 hypothetical protein BA92_12865 [Sanguibacteroides justesenii]PXZ44079.1 hypothetical protein DMB45_05280 [Sanguibacteroides justesenii]